MKNINELKKGVKELVIALLKCKPTKDKEIIDFNVRAFMGGFEDYLSNQSDEERELKNKSADVILEEITGVEIYKNQVYYEYSFTKIIKAMQKYANQSDVSDEEIEKQINSNKRLESQPIVYCYGYSKGFKDCANWMRYTPKKEERNNRCSYDVVTCKYRGENQNCSNQGFCIGMLNLFNPPIKEGEKELPWSVNAEDYVKEWEKNPIKELKDKEEENRFCTCDGRPLWQEQGICASCNKHI